MSRKISKWRRFNLSSMFRAVCLKLFFFIPVTILELFIKQKKVVIRGQVLDFQSSIFLALQPKGLMSKISADAIPTVRDLIENRKIKSRLSRTHPNQVEKIDHYIKDDERNTEFLLREYSPKNPSKDVSILFIHGGGFVMDSVAVYDDMISYFSGYLDATIYSLEYSLAPEHKYPVAILQAKTAYDWIHINRDQRISICGDSAGGYLAASLTKLLIRKFDTKPHSQLLLYPTCGPRIKSESMELFAEGFFLSAKDLNWFWEHFIGSTNQKTSLSINLLESSIEEDLSTTIIVTAGFDPICDEGRNYAQLLKEKGVDTTLIHYPTLFHGFAFMSKLTTAYSAVNDFLRKYKAILKD